MIALALRTVRNPPDFLGQVDSACDPVTVEVFGLDVDSFDQLGMGVGVRQIAMCRRELIDLPFSSQSSLSISQRLWANFIG